MVRVELFDQGGNEGAEQRFASLAGVVDQWKKPTATDSFSHNMPLVWFSDM